MKIRPLFIGLAIGVIATTIVAVFSLYGNNLRWQRQAYEHYAGVYYLDKNKHTAKWMWTDDYFRKLLQEDKEEFHGTPTPIPSSRMRL